MKDWSPAAGIICGFAMIGLAFTPAMADWSPLAAVLCGFVMVGGSGAVWSWRVDRRIWNGGRCAACGTDWRSFDTHSSGAIGYKCSCPEQHEAWLNWDWPRAGAEPAIAEAFAGNDLDGYLRVRRK